MKDLADSFMLKTVQGEFIHIADVCNVSSVPYRDESGLTNALATDCTEGTHLWIKTETGISNIYLDDPFNCKSMGVDPAGYIAYNSDPFTMQVERRIIETWARIRYPGLKIEDLRNGDSTKYYS